MSKTCHTLKSFFLRFDSFGVSIQMKLFQRDQYQTIYGSILSLILFGILCWKTITLALDMITKKEFVYEFLDLPDINTPLQMNNFTLAACPLNQDSYSNWIFSNFSNMNSSSIPEIPPYECPLSKLYGSDYNGFQYCFCYDLDSHVLKDANDVSNKSISIGLITNNQSSSSNAPKDSSTSNTLSSDIALFYSYSFVETRDYYNPIRVKNQMHYIQGLKGKNVNIDFNVENIEIIKINDFLPINADQQDISKNFTLMSSVNLQTITTNTEDGMIMIQFNHAGWMKRYIFDGFNSDDFFSILGGYYQIWIWLFTLIGTFINGIGLQYAIISNLVPKKEYEIVSKVKILKENNKLICNGESGEQIPKSVNSLKRNNKSSIESQLVHINEERSFKSNKNISMENPISNRIIIQREHELWRQKPFDSVEQFESAMDYAKMYKLIQEVKLLELLCLDQNNANVFFNSIEGEFNLEHLETSLKNASLGLSEEHNPMDCHQKKLDILLNSMIDENTIQKESTLVKIKNCLCNCKK